MKKESKVNQAKYVELNLFPEEKEYQGSLSFLIIPLRYPFLI